MSGQTVEFKLVENNSGATLITQNAVTDAAGQAIATYRAGGKEPAQDVVQAKLLSNGSVSSVIIDVTGGASGASIAVAASPDLRERRTGQHRHCHVDRRRLRTRRHGHLHAAGQQQRRDAVRRDRNDGRQRQGGRDLSGGDHESDVSVSDTVQAAVGSISSTAVITRTGSATSAFSITVSAAPSTLASVSSSSVLTANVKNNLGTAVSGVTVKFTATRGSLSVLSSDNGREVETR